MIVLSNVVLSSAIPDYIPKAFWFILVVVFIVVEIISLGLTSIWFAVGAFAAGIVAIIFPNQIWLQCIVFIVVSAIALGSTRGLATKYLNNKLEKTNAEGLVGDTVYVIEEIDNKKATGKIRVRDLEWTARAVSDDQIIPKDTKVVVREIQGVKCIVEPIRNMDGATPEVSGIV